MYLSTTNVSADRSMADMQTALVAFGARRIMQEFDDGGRIVGMAFTILDPDRGELPFKLPVRTQTIFAACQEEWKHDSKRIEKQRDDRERAERIAWRQLLYWVRAQLAMMETGMVAAVEVFLPYMQLRDGATVYERYLTNGFKALPAPEDVE